MANWTARLARRSQGRPVVPPVAPNALHVAPAAPRIERASGADLGQLAVDAGSVPNHLGAVITIEAAASLDAAAARELLADRLRGVPRLRQRLMPLPVGYGPPVWVDDPHFDIDRHVALVSCPPPGDEAMLLDLAAGQVTTPLPRSRPLWSATVVDGVADGRIALILVLHHVVADGIGGLAVLARLLDGAPAAPSQDFPRPPPSRRQLRSDAVARWITRSREVPGALARGRAAVRELGGRPPVAPRCSLNVPTGPRRRVAVVRVGIAEVKEIAHAHGAKVNDVLLNAVAAALAEVLRRRGEDVEPLVVTMLVAPRPTDAASAIGNQAGIAPVDLPTRGTPGERLRAIAAATRSRKDEGRGASAAVLGLGLRLLARLRLLRWFMDHQRSVHTFVTNLRGPEQPVSFAGMRVSDLVPISLATGNVTVSFAALSYAGTLSVTVVTDPDHFRDLDLLVTALANGLRSPRSG